MAAHFDGDKAQSWAFLRTLAAALVGGVFLYAALAKAASPFPMIESMGSLFAIDLPAHLGTAMVGGLVLLECALGGLLLSGWRRRLSAAIALGTLAVFSLALTKLTLDPTAPPCGCTGGSKLLSGDAQSTNLAGLIRNGFLMATCAWLTTSPSESAPTTEDDRGFVESGAAG